MPNCCVDKCSKEAAASRGMCWAHYKRDIRYGSPTAGRPSFEGDGPAWVEWAARQETDACLLFPFAGASLYGVVIHNGVSMVAARATAFLALGPPEKGEFVLHSCREKACCNKRHLRWGFHAENMADRVRDGTNLPGVLNPNSKLDDAAVRAIRAARGTEPQTRTAFKYGVAQSTVSSIQRRETWKHVA